MDDFILIGFIITTYEWKRDISSFLSFISLCIFFLFPSVFLTVSFSLYRTCFFFSLSFCLNPSLYLPLLLSLSLPFFFFSPSLSICFSRFPSPLLSPLSFLNFSLFPSLSLPFNLPPPFPLCIYQNTYYLPIGDTLTISVKKGTVIYTLPCC